MRTGMSLADSVKNTKINSITTIKTKIGAENRKNLILTSNCICKRKYKIIRTKFNETGKMAARHITTKKGRCDEFGHAYKEVKFHKGLFYSCQTTHLLKYLHWMHRHKMDGRNCSIEYPMWNFKRHIECKCCITKKKY